MPHRRRFNAIIIDPIPDSRSALKEFLHNEQLYHHLVYQGVFVLGTPLEAITKISDGEAIDVIFISSKFAVSEIQGFIKTAKESEQRSGTAYIIVLNGNERGGTLVAQAMAFGADGFLVLPCSVQELRDITVIAQNVKAAAHERMIRVALTLLIDTLLGEIEVKVREYYEQGRVTRYKRQFRDATASLLQGDAVTREQYLELLQEALSRAKPSASTDERPKSKRVRKLLSEKSKKNDNGPSVIVRRG